MKRTFFVVFTSVVLCLLMFIALGFTKKKLNAKNYRFLRDVGTAELGLKGPKGLAVDSQGNIYVSDSWNNRILKLDSEGNLIAVYGREGSGDGELSGPTGLVVDAADNLYVSDNGNNRIQKFDPKGNYIAQWGSPGNGEGEFKGPTGLAVDSKGDVYVSDIGNHRIQVFTPEQ
jgi:DNA-binding beta-propeller fold protein YncE